MEYLALFIIISEARKFVNNIIYLPNAYKKITEKLFAQQHKLVFTNLENVNITKYITNTDKRNILYYYMAHSDNKRRPFETCTK